MSVETEAASEFLADTTIPEAYARAWDLRREHFEDTVHFHAPSWKHYETSEFEAGDAEFVSMSTTGGRCGLACDHCDGAVLEDMTPVADDDQLSEMSRILAERGGDGMLLSGGCDTEGRVRFEDYLGGIREADRRDLDVALHTGLVDDRDVALSYDEAGADAAMIDIIGAEETIQQVYGLEKAPAAYERSLEILAETNLKLIPHVVVGLHYGEIRGEWKALEMISRFDVHALLLVVLEPIDGVPMAGVDPPAPADVGEVFRRAREILPETEIMLGCARPKNRGYSLDIEERALKAGLNGIAFPSDGVIAFAERMGLEPALNKRCCSLRGET